MRLALAILLVGLLARDAWPCSPAPTIGDRTVRPNGQSGVPTNTRILVRYRYGGPAQPAFELREQATGATVAITSVLDGAWIVQPIDPLAPQTTYDLLDDVVVPCLDPPAPDACVGPMTVVASFTTGDGPDTTPPVFSGLTGATRTWDDSCQNDACCGPYTAWHFTLQLDPASDDFAVAGYSLYEDGSRVVFWSPTTGMAFCQFSPEASWLADIMATPAAHRFVFRAFDFAGNEEQNDVIVDLDLSCSSAPGIDAGPPDAMLPATDAASSAEDDQQGGCGCRTGRRPSTPILPFASLLALVFVRFCPAFVRWAGRCRR